MLKAAILSLRVGGSIGGWTLHHSSVYYGHNSWVCISSYASLLHEVYLGSGWEQLLRNTIDQLVGLLWPTPQFDTLSTCLCPTSSEVTVLLVGSFCSLICRWTTTTWH